MADFCEHNKEPSIPFRPA